MFKTNLYFENYGKFKLNGNLNHSFTNRYDNPFKSNQNGNKVENNDNKVSYIKRKKYSVNNLEINCINNINDNNDNKIILKKIDRKSVV